jgi:hypothetical protein
MPGERKKYSVRFGYNVTEEKIFFGSAPMQDWVAGLLVVGAGVYLVWYLVWHFVGVGRQKGVPPSCAGCLGCQAPVVPLEDGRKPPSWLNPSYAPQDKCSLHS